MSKLYKIISFDEEIFEICNGMSYEDFNMRCKNILLNKDYNELEYLLKKVKKEKNKFLKDINNAYRFDKNFIESMYIDYSFTLLDDSFTYDVNTPYFISDEKIVYINARAFSNRYNGIYFLCQILAEYSKMKIIIRNLKNEISDYYKTRTGFYTKTNVTSKKDIVKFLDEQEWIDEEAEIKKQEQEDKLREEQNLKS